MHDCHVGRLKLCHGIDDLLLIEDLPPRDFNLLNQGTATFSRICHASAKHAVDADEEAITGFNQISDHSLHAGRTRAAYRERHLIFCLKDLLELGADAVHHLQEDGVQMTNRRPTQCFENTSGNITGTRAEQYTFRNG